MTPQQRITSESSLKSTEELFNPPFSVNFANQSDLDYFTILDCNNDAKKWEWNQQGFVALMYNSYQAANDYLVSPGMNLKAGYIYTFSVEARPYQGQYPEKMALWVGNAPTADALNINLLPVTTLTEGKWVPFEGTFTPEADGVYYFAVQGCSDADQYALLVNTFKIDAGVNSASPTAPIISVVRDAEGEPMATISVTAPLTTVSGEPLESLTSLKVFRDNELIREITGMQPGDILTFVDKDLTVTDHTWHTYATNENGDGMQSSGSCFTGVYYATWPSEVSVSVGENEGQVVLNWPASEFDQNGNPLKSEQVTYEIYRIHNGNVGIIASGLSEPTYVDQVCEPDAQMREVQYTVFARTSYGLSAGTGSGVFYAGKPYELPFAESVSGGQIGSLFHTRGLENYAAGWDIADMNTYDIAIPTEAADNDGGFLYHRAYNVGERSMIGTAKIAIPANIQDATLTFATYLSGTTNQNTLEVTVSDCHGNISEPLVYTQAGAAEWKDFSYDLTPYAGQTIQIRWTNNVKTNILTAIDNIRVNATVDPSGVEDVNSDDSAQESRYYNIQGMQLKNIPDNGAYIVRQGNKTSKHIGK